MSLLRPQDSVVYFVGKFGDDEEGKWLFNTLSEEYSVNLKHSESIRNVSSGTGFCFIVEGGRRVFRRCPWRKRRMEAKSALPNFFADVFSSSDISTEDRTCLANDEKSMVTLFLPQKLFFYYNVRFQMP